MVKILGIAMIMVSSSMIGIYKSSGLSSRVLALESVLLLIEKIKVNIRYNQTHTIDLILQLSELDCLKTLDFLHIFKDKVKVEDDFPKLWEDSIKQSQLSLTQTDKNILISLKDILGTFDMEGQFSGLDMCVDMIQTNLEEARKIKNVKGKLYRNLGVLSGIGISVLFI